MSSLPRRRHDSIPGIFLRGPGRALPLLVPVLLAAACGGEYPQSTVDPVTDFGDTIHSLYIQVFVWSMIILGVVWLLLAWILFRFRERPDGPEPIQTHGNLLMEIGWTVAPALIVVAIAIPTIRAVFSTQGQPPDDALVVDVVGHRYWWEFRYPETGVVTANELHLPVGRPVSLRLHSADVIHSFWVPRLGGKRDVNPLRAVPQGRSQRYTWLHFTIREPGVYSGQCAEFCGEAHSLMGVKVFAESPEEFRDWLEAWQEVPPQAEPEGDSDPAIMEDEERIQVPGQEPRDTAGERVADSIRAVADAVGPAPEWSDPDLIARGREVFHNESFCVACHAINGTDAQGILGPDLTRLGARTTLAAGLVDNDPETLATWITAPRDMKPGAEMPGVDDPGGGWPATSLTPEQVRAVAAYLSSLR